MFENADAYYQSNKKKWKEEQEYESIRQARWAKDEARKEQVKQKKITNGYAIRADAHHKNINYNSSEGENFIYFGAFFQFLWITLFLAQKENDDTEYMFTITELPYKSYDDLKLSKKAEVKLIKDCAIFEFLNWKDGQRQIKTNEVESAVLCKRREFNPEP